MHIMRVLLVTACFFSSFAWGWGVTGHRVVAEIAAKNLSKETAKRVSKLLRGYSMAYVANWADQARHDKEWKLSATWHYVNIPDGKTYMSADKNPTGDLLTAISKRARLLRSKKVSKSKKEDALKFIIHLMGDLHQPLHWGRKIDKGGNLISLGFFKNSTNLHEVWDEDIIDFHKLSFTEWVRFLSEKFGGLKKKHVCKGRYKKWGHETFRLRDQAYNSAKQGDNLTYEYARKYTPIIEKQLYRAGLRLACFLEKNL